METSKLDSFFSQCLVLSVYIYFYLLLVETSLVMIGTGLQV